MVALTAPVAVAQTSTPTSGGRVTITKYTCQHDPGTINVNRGDVPPASAQCTFGVGITFTVVHTADGSAVGSCTTGTNGTCTVTVTGDSHVTVTEENPPAGYVPRQNPIQTQAGPTEFGGSTVFVNLPVAQPTTGSTATTAAPTATATAPTTLPTTGAGTTAGPLSPLLTGMLLLAVVGLVLGAWTLRRRRA